MGLAEMAALLFVIVTVCQYIISWAVYAEKKYTAVNISSYFRNYLFYSFAFLISFSQETLLGSKLKKIQKKNKTLVDIDTILNSIPTPSIKNTLPFQIVRGVWHAPGAVKQLFHTYAEYKEEERIKKEL